MSIIGDVSNDIHQKMMDLQEKLKQSEAKRTRLEEMFHVLIKTFKEEEDLRFKNLENRYRLFLEDCAKRSYRNETILRSVERVESGANALHAKTERLKLLRNHYEAYLERIIPTWRRVHPYGSNALPPTPEIAWNRRNQIIPEEIGELSYELFNPSRPSSVSSKNTPSRKIFFENPRNRSLENDTLNTSYSVDNVNKNYWNKPIKEPQTRVKLNYFQDCDLNSPELVFQGTRCRSPFEEERETSEIKELESELQRKVVLTDNWPGKSNLMPQTDTPNSEYQVMYKDIVKPCEALNKLTGINTQKWPSKNGKTDNSNKKGLDDNRPMITREPTEIKKPEFFAGKLHSEASLKSDLLKITAEESHNKHINKENALYSEAISDPLIYDGKIQPSDNEENKMKLVNADLQNKWYLLKQKRTIDKLKESLLIEGADHCQRITEGPRSVENTIKLSMQSYNTLDKDVEGDEMKIPPSSDEEWQVRQEAVEDHTPDSEKNGAERTEFNHHDFKIQEPEFQETEIQPETQESNEALEDNEEVYPESYYEQPPKPDYSRNIVSNVILEEDESEVHMSDGGLDKITVSEDLEKGPQFDIVPGENETINQADYNMYGTKEMKENENQFQNMESYNAEMYTNEHDIYEQQYTYGQQEDQSYNDGNNYNPENYSQEQLQYFEQSQEHGYEDLNQCEAYENAMNEQVQNYENNTGLNDCVGDGAVYEQQYDQAQETEGGYYNQGEYDERYYPNQYDQNGQYTGEPQGEATSQNTDKNGTGGSIVFSSEGNNLPLRQSNLAHLLESDTESFQMEHGSAGGNEDSDFDFSISQKEQ